MTGAPLPAADQGEGATPPPLAPPPRAPLTDLAKHKLETDPAIALKVMGSFAKLRDLRVQEAKLEGEMVEAIAWPHIKRACEAKDFAACAPFLAVLDPGGQMKIRDYIARRMACESAASSPVSLWCTVFNLEPEAAAKLRRLTVRNY